MRIAQLANFYTPTSGGIRTALDELGNEYRRGGHDRLLIVPGRNDSFVQGPGGAMTTIASPRIPGAGGYRLILDRAAVTRVLRAYRPDVLG